MKKAEFIKELKETELRVIAFQEKLIPIKIQSETNAKNLTSDQCDFILDNLRYFYMYTSDQMKESLNYFKSKHK